MSALRIDFPAGGALTNVESISGSALDVNTTNISLGYNAVANSTSIAIGTSSKAALSDVCIGSGVGSTITGGFNVAVGYNAMNNMINSVDQRSRHNVCIGYKAGGSLTGIGPEYTAGSYNVFIGDLISPTPLPPPNPFFPLNLAAASRYNIAIGRNIILSHLTNNCLVLGHNITTDGYARCIMIGTSVEANTGNDQIVIGNAALGDGEDTVAIGSSSNAYGWRSVAIGENAYANNESVAIGLNSNADGGLGSSRGNTVAIGNGASCEGYGCISVGKSASSAGATPTGLFDGKSIAIGFNSSASTNAAISIGHGARTAGTNCIIIGKDAGSTNITGTENICVGVAAGSSITSGTNNICIGGAMGPSGTTSNTCFIKNIRGATTGMADAVNVLVDSDGQLGTVSSSLRFKTNVRDLEPVNIFNLHAKRFEFIDNGVESIGMIAEELNEFYPELVPTDKDKLPFSIRYELLCRLLIKHAQQLQAELDDLKERIALLE